MSSLRDAVRDKLREDKVKLWLPPYDDASKVDALAKAYAAGSDDGWASGAAGPLGSAAFGVLPEFVLRGALLPGFLFPTK